MSADSNAGRHARAKAIFGDALEREPAERPGFVERACAGDAELLRAVREMLTVDESWPDFLEEAAPLSLAGGAPPERLGPFRVLSVLGEGGMAVVYEAEQDRPRRRVALKVLHPGLASARLLRRFEFESELLGRLQHPGIARVYAAGATDTGRGPQPWLAMELVDGEHLNLHAERRGLSLEERLELIARVCDAVQHAHQRGVVHRDLKPANVLVDASGAPRVLDFGVARATDADLRPATLETDAGRVVGTLRYMSPEQAAADTDAIDARSDVYSLGVMLYELVGGAPPIDASDAPLHEVLRRVIEDEPAPLAARARRVPADVAVIAHQALAKDRDRRYASAAALADDLRRFLRREPIAAQPPTAWYRARRFAARNKALVGGVAATFLALVAGLVATLRQVRETARAEAEAVHGRRAAEDALARAEAMHEFLLSDLLGAPVPGRLGHDARVVDVLGPAERLAERTFADRPQVAVEVLDSVGGSYLALGLYAEAEAALRRALALLETSPEPHLALRVRGRLVEALSQLGRGDEAHALALEVARASAELLGPEAPETLEARTWLAFQRWEAGERGPALAELRALQETRVRVLGPQHEETLASAAQLQGFLAVAGEGEEAREGLRRAAADAERVLGADHPIALASKERLAWLASMASDWEEADRVYGELLPALARVYGAGHPYVAQVELRSARAAMKRGDLDAAGARVEAGLAALEARLGPDHEWTQDARLEKVELAFRTGRYDEAIELARAVVASRRHGDDREALGFALGTLGRAHQEAGDLEAAARTYREAVEVLLESAGGAPNDFVAQQLYNLGVVERDAGHSDAAIDALGRALEIDLANWGAASSNVVSDRGNLARALRAAGRLDEAVEELQEALRALDELAAQGSGDERRRLGWALELGHVQRARGERVLAEARFRAVVLGWEALGRPDERGPREARAALSELLEERGDGAR